MRRAPPPSIRIGPGRNHAGGDVEVGPKRPFDIPNPPLHTNCSDLGLGKPWLPGRFEEKHSNVQPHGPDKCLVDLDAQTAAIGQIDIARFVPDRPVNKVTLRGAVNGLKFEHIAGGT